MLQLVATYSFIAYSGYKIFEKLKLATKKSKMQHVQKQITNILLVQVRLLSSVLRPLIWCLGN